MITHTTEGAEMSIGLNWHIAWKQRWFRLIWVWCNPQGDCKSWYFRFRLKLSPHFLTHVSEWNAIENFMFNHRVVLLSEESFADFVIPSAKRGGIDPDTLPISPVRRFTLFPWPHRYWELVSKAEWS